MQLILSVVVVAQFVGTNAEWQIQCFVDNSRDRSLQNKFRGKEVLPKPLRSPQSGVGGTQTQIDGSHLDSSMGRNINQFQSWPSHSFHSNGQWRRGQLLESNKKMNKSSISKDEVTALISFKRSISNDPLSSLSNWGENDSLPCSWTGVSCSTSRSSRSNRSASFGSNHVISLNLTGMKLQGNIDLAIRALGRLQFLERLDLSNNSFIGPMSGQAFGNWTGLLSLNMSDNFITGVLPPEIRQLINIQVLDFHVNNLTGEIPPSIFNCTVLSALDLGTNFLSGSFPDQVGRLSNLELLSLGNDVTPFLNFHPEVHGNSFTGTIPASLGNCTSLKTLRLQTNLQLGGEILPILTQLKNLEFVRISYCNFQGSIPAEIGNLTKLRFLSLGDNQFHGQVPTQIGNLHNLQSLYLNNNNFSGIVPISIVNCTEMLSLSFQENELVTGEIPSEIGRLSKLLFITFWSNGLTGIIPASLSNCSALQILEIYNVPTMYPQPMPLWLSLLQDLVWIYLDRINLYDTVPKELGKLSNLEALSVYSNNLTGGIPPELGNCSSLRLVQLEGNHLTGPIPPEIGLLSNLQKFLAGYGHMSGLLPVSLGNLTQLEDFEIQDNFFTGTIGDYWGTLTQLGYISFHNNNFVGSIPTFPANLSQLQSIDFSSNNLTGEIPASFGSLPSLGELDLSNNQLSGMIPTELLNASLLSILDLSQNNLGGSIPFNIRALSNLQYLHLGSNKLGGRVPDSLKNCRGLLIMDLSNNQFEGIIPADILTAISSLITLDLSSNKFSGAWPPQMSTLANLEELNASGNNLSGPFYISNSGSEAALSRSEWISLRSLDISYNDFTGDLPAALGLLPALDFFNASYNNFDGQVPTTFSGIYKFNESSFLGNPNLCGEVLGPDRKCRHASSTKSCHGFGCKRVWIPTISGVVVFLASIAIVSLILFYARAAHPVDKKKMGAKFVSLNSCLEKGLLPMDILKVIHQKRDNVIGMGSRSIVYKGLFADNQTFAVKVLLQKELQCRCDAHVHEEQAKADSYRTQDVLLKEVEVMAKLRHRNILKVIGYCSDNGTEALILEYMPKGSLHGHIHMFGNCRSQLLWGARLSIVLGIAEGMKYLHHDFPEPLIHGDLKPSNILLDMEWIPKVADFGLSKFVSRHCNSQATVSSIHGTIGYIPPEYALGTVVSTAGDVYSFGILIIELLTGRSPAANSSQLLVDFDPSVDQSHVSESSQLPVNFDPSIDLRSLILKNFHDNPMSMVDLTLKEESMAVESIREQIRLTMLVALLCTMDLPQSRPTMNQTLSMLTQIREIGSISREKKSLEELANSDHAGIKFWIDEYSNRTFSLALSS